MRVLVTGGAGFIGSHYVRGLLAGAWPEAELPVAQLTVLDKLSYSGNRASLRAASADPRLHLVIGDICDARLVDQVMAGQDLVVHFAAESHVDRSIAAPSTFVNTNVLGTQVLLDAALRHGVGRFVHVSTDEVYGSTDSGAWTERQPLAPRSPYAAAKASSDLFALAYHHTFGAPVVVTRCSNNYGPYQFPEKVIPLFITNLLDGRPVPLYGDGRHVREWLHVDDHCLGIQLVASRGRIGDIYHIGGGLELSNHELTDRLLDACGASWRMVEFVEDRKGHDRRYALDCAKIHAELGYRPRVDFPSGLAATVGWYRENRAWWEPLRVPGASVIAGQGR